MAYLGNAPVVGDSSNTFKLLDDIASFTLTFDGSSTDVVSVANDTLTFTNHRFITGQRVTYTDGGGTVITGLTDGTAYFIIKVDQSTIKLATNASNAASSTAIDLTGVGAGASHTLKIAFDGVNTKFKATHSNGTKASVSRAAQLSLSINGVIQQPTEAKPPTVGYGIEADSTIVFSTAPITTDKVFGSFIGEVAPSFDLTDNTISNFTGDGSTVSFNLSKEIPSSQDVLVTLDGVTQYPTDTSTTRAYSVIGSTLTFTTAPADGVAIQTRLIGFAGATTSEVTGFYGRTGNAALKNTDDITFQNASAGIITASKFVGVSSMTDVFVSGITSFTNATDSTSSSTGAVIVSGGVGIAGSLNVGGSVSVGGTLSYEDVTNIDSVGIITARSNILVGSGITLSPDGDVFATGISTFSEGFAGDVLIDDKIVHRGDTDTAIRFPTANAFSVETGGDERLRIDSGGRLLVGTDTARQTRAGNASYQPDIQLESEVAGLSLCKFNDSDGPSRLTLQKARGSISSPTIVQDNDEIGSITFSGWDGDTFTNAAMIRSEVEGTPGDDDMPGNLTFYTTSDGSSVSSERLRITSDGNIYTNGDQTRDGARLTLTTDKVGVSTSINLHNSNGSGTATKISASKSIILSADYENNSGAVSSYISFETDATEKVRINSGGQFEVKEGEIRLTKQGASNLIRLGLDQNASNYAYIDLIGDTNYTNYGLRLIRNNGGENTDSLLIHRGTGVLTLQATESGKIAFKTQDQERLRISSGGVLLKGHNIVSSDIHDPQTTTSRAPGIQIHGGNSVQSSAALISWNSNTGSYYSNALFLAHSGSDTIGTNGAVSGSNTLGTIVFSGDDGDEFVKGAMISAHVDGTPGNNDMPTRLMFYTNNGDSTPDERVRIDASGNFFVDCTSEPLQGDSGVRITNGSYHTFARAANTASVIRSFGNNGEFRTLGNGNVQNTNNSYGSISDIELKENIVDANSQLNDIKALKIRSYNFKESTGYNTHKQIGVVAQELEASGLNGLVETNPDELYIAGDEIPDGKNIGDVKEKGYKTVKYSVLYMKAIKALQEAIAKIETLEAKVSALEG